MKLLVKEITYVFNKNQILIGINTCIFLFKTG